MNEERFLSLFLQHERELAGVARACLPTWDAVDDVLQESSLVMWRKIDQLRSDDEFLPWAKVILRFEILKYRRSLSRDRLLLDDELVELIAVEESSTPADLHAERRSAVQACLEKFSTEHRTLLLAPYMRDDAVKSIAEAAGKTANSLYKRLGRLRLKLHDCVHLRLGTPR
ncbi:sigma-70 family RNA polymerase sigma factor [Blastopirellula sp. JC732]|uniref:Sigma-70 family RNA polymerase sigma factor n=1 Tax=Blastopirellula sediminis TaxID=2894196 RepID=A0A9X1SF75_9BACT|nr:sigma-70 family RNA polymerase sigma factor [Blastopirellula sediminis]MCC9608383.1 sigma-70 family RNA polymerase sigma factor [Blastopirellula sediminis]MCC9628840.1 sigma-70 family RNA polymerase sigma factor [Blastopirellula sediminis]